MLYFNIWLTVKDRDDIEKVRELLVEQCRRSRQEPGCSRFDVYHSTTDDTRFLLNEHWESQADVDAHRKAYAYTNVYQPKVLPLVSREPHPSTLL